MRIVLNKDALTRARAARATSPWTRRGFFRARALVAHKNSQNSREQPRKHTNPKLERETGFEPATSSLEGSRSTHRAIPARENHFEERGAFEPPKASPADLQSAPFDHSGTSPYFITILYRARSYRVSFTILGSFGSVRGKKETRISADGESRTRDLLITSQLLYQLSYIGPDPETVLFIQQYAPCQRNSIPSTRSLPRFTGGRPRAAPSKCSSREAFSPARR